MAVCTMTQALKKLYKAVVGSATNKKNPTKIIDDLAENWSSGGGGGGGSSSDFFRIKFSTSDMTNFTCDKTFAEMKAARDAGKYFIATYELSVTNPGGITVEGTASLATWGYSSQTNKFTFAQSNFDEDGDQNIAASIAVFTVSSTDVIDATTLSGTISST